MKLENKVNREKDANRQFSFPFPPGLNLKLPICFAKKEVGVEKNIARNLWGNL